jgi:metallophosphoesterase (TIGR00282 family)
MSPLGLRADRARPNPNPMKILFLGDVMGRAGRAAITERLPGLRTAWGLDFVVVNGENASQGAGLTAEHARVLLAAGADCLTLGDHAFDQKDMLHYIEQEPRIIRPLNFSKVAPGRGVKIFEATQGRKVLVAQVLGQVFMKRPFDDPFSAIEQVLKTHRIGGAVQAAIVDVHAEATSEKMAMGHWCDGQASLVVGTHTHVPTGDAMILPKGTAYLTDAGMCGDYNSVIGMEKLEPLRRFITGMSSARFEPAGGPATLSGVYVETDDRTGKAVKVRMIRQGGVLEQSAP